LDGIELCPISHLLAPRFVQDHSTWALLAGLAIAANELSTAECAFGALDAVDKLQYVLHAKGMVSEEIRAAELAAYRRQPEQAEALLLKVRPKNALVDHGQSHNCMDEHLHLLAFSCMVRLLQGTAWLQHCPENNYTF
jgi:hypothetical protein